MKICPIAIAVGCPKCPAFKVCPLKTSLGGYTPEPPAPAEKVKKSASKSAAARKPAAKKSVKR
jgi:hypothetical protein